MRKINRMDVIKIMLVLALVAGTGLAIASVGRFEPTHMITKEVYCGSCHPEEVQELNATTHLAHFAKGVSSGVVAAGGNPVSAAESISDGCEMCHSYWDNLPNYGVANLSVSQSQQNVLLLTDIYGNTVSPSGLSTTALYAVNITGVGPWQGGLNAYRYTDSSGTNWTRLDYLWSDLSSISPMPALFNDTNKSFVSVTSHGTTSKVLGDTSQGATSCGAASAERGMCHIAQTAVTQMELGKLMSANGIASETSALFRHEMAYTTDQYAAKPVKMCAVCHVDKLPPMTWGGEPWSQGVIEAASANNGSAPIALNGVNNNPYDPFGFAPAYDSTGFISMNNAANSTAALAVTYKTPDWAHANVPCIRCHEHAGINGATVSDNSPANTSGGSPIALPYNKGEPTLP
jgi:hypothetical protein